MRPAGVAGSDRSCDRLRHAAYSLPPTVQYSLRGLWRSVPYLPSLRDSRGLSAGEIALLLGAGTAIRLAAGPAAGRLADRLDTPKAILVICMAAASLIVTGYLSTRELWPLFIVGVLHSAVLASLAPLSDTLALGSAAPAQANNSHVRGFHYGWLRGAGSAAFIFGTILSGQMIGQFGINALVWLNAGLACGSGSCRSSGADPAARTKCPQTGNRKSHRTCAHNAAAAANLPPGRSRRSIGPRQPRNA